MDPYAIQRLISKHAASPAISNFTE